jgi:DNA-binding transcriptional ArsR family regulator
MSGSSTIPAEKRATIRLALSKGPMSFREVASMLEVSHKTATKYLSLLYQGGHGTKDIYIARWERCGDNARQYARFYAWGQEADAPKLKMTPQEKRARYYAKVKADPVRYSTRRRDENDRRANPKPEVATGPATWLSALGL